MRILKDSGISVLKNKIISKKVLGLFLGLPNNLIKASFDDACVTVSLCKSCCLVVAQMYLRIVNLSHTYVLTTNR